MKLIIVLSFLVCCCIARPQQPSWRDAVIKKYEIENDGSGNYKFAYETSDGQAREEEAELQNIGTDDEALVVRGSFSFIGDDGVMYSVKYVADKDGFRPEGAHIPRRTPQIGLPAGALGSLVGGGLG